MDLTPFVKAINKQELNVKSVVVFQGGKEAAHHRWALEKRCNIRSVAKGFMSIAIGMAIDEAKLKLSDKISLMFPMKKFQDPLINTRWDSLTLENLLTMTMGHTDFSRPRNLDEALLCELSLDPGSSFFYDNTSAFLASVMLTKATGLTPRNYLMDRLFKPLGIPAPDWAESADGYTIGGTGLYLTTSEMARFGQFLLQRGNWEGKQLVSAAWIDAATKVHVSTGKNDGNSGFNQGYGYFFWISPNGVFRCEGSDGQFIVVFPDRDTVIAICSEEENMTGILRAVWDFMK